jgi:hypothetical protein
MNKKLPCRYGCILQEIKKNKNFESVFGVFIVA